MDPRPATLVDSGRSHALGEGRAVSSTASVDDHGDTWITHELVNDGADLIADFVRPWTVRVPVSGGPDEHRAMVHGFHSFSGSGSYSFAEAPPLIVFKPSRLTAHNMFALPSGRPGTLVSSMFTTVCRADGSTPITVGTCDPRHHVTQVVATWLGDAIEITVQVQLERQVLRHGERLVLPPVFVSHAPAHIAQRRWAQRVVEQVGTVIHTAFARRLLLVVLALHQDQRGQPARRPRCRRGGLRRRVRAVPRRRRLPIGGG